MRPADDILCRNVRSYDRQGHCIKRSPEEVVQSRRLHPYYRIEISSCWWPDSPVSLWLLGCAVVLKGEDTSCAHHSHLLPFQRTLTRYLCLFFFTFPTAIFHLSICPQMRTRRLNHCPIYCLGKAQNPLARSGCLALQTPSGCAQG